MFTYRSLLIFPFLLFLLRFFCFDSEKIFEFKVDLSPRRHSASRTLDILILIVVDSKSDINEYKFPLNTVKCYARQHNYRLKIFNDSEYLEKCPQKDYMFRRHCIAAQLLQTTEWLLFLDADIAVVNPQRLIEEYIDKQADLIMYDRFDGWEIAMGSYLAKNTTWTKDFLMKFADFENELPDSFHGTDNGAIHAFVVKELLSDALSAAEQCLAVWRSSRGFEDLFLFEACIRTVIGARERIGPLLIVPKGRGWVRDVWLTTSLWSPERDFMLHGFKSSDRRLRTGISFLDKARELISSRFIWYSFLTSDLRPDTCNWSYVPALQVPSEDIEALLKFRYRQVEHRRWRTLARLSANPER